MVRGVVSANSATGESVVRDARRVLWRIGPLRVVLVGSPYQVDARPWSVAPLRAEGRFEALRFAAEVRIADCEDPIQRALRTVGERADGKAQRGISDRLDLHVGGGDAFKTDLRNQDRPLAGSVSQDELSTHVKNCSESPVPTENCNTACAGAESAATTPPAVAMDRSKRDSAFMMRTLLIGFSELRCEKVRTVKPASIVNNQQM